MSECENDLCSTKLITKFRLGIVWTHKSTCMKHKVISLLYAYSHLVKCRCNTTVGKTCRLYLPYPNLRAPPSTGHSLRPLKINFLFHGQRCTTVYSVPAYMIYTVCAQAPSGFSLIIVDTFIISSIPQTGN